MQHNFPIRGKGTGDTECPVPSAALPSLWLCPQLSLHLEAAGWRRRQPGIPGLEHQGPYWDADDRSWLLFIVASPRLWRVLIRGQNRQEVKAWGVRGLWILVAIKFSNNSSEPFKENWREEMRFWSILDTSWLSGEKALLNSHVP